MLEDTKESITSVRFLKAPRFLSSSMLSQIPMEVTATPSTLNVPGDSRYIK